MVSPTKTTWNFIITHSVPNIYDISQNMRFFGVPCDIFSKFSLVKSKIATFFGPLCSNFWFLRKILAIFCSEYLAHWLLDLWKTATGKTRYSVKLYPTTLLLPPAPFTSCLCIGIHDPSSYCDCIIRERINTKLSNTKLSCFVFYNYVILWCDFWKTVVYWLGIGGLMVGMRMSPFVILCLAVVHSAQSQVDNDNY